MSGKQLMGRWWPGAVGILIGIGLAASWFVLKPASSAEPGHTVPKDRVGVAIAAVHGGPIEVSGTLREGRAWSAIKVPLAVAFLDARAKAAGTTDGLAAMSARERAWLRRALTRSDNDAASKLFWRMAGGHAHPEQGRAELQATLDRAGVGPIRVRVQFGTTVWRIEDAVRFYQRLAAGCLLSERDTSSVVEMMSLVEDSERWGVPEVVRPPTTVAFKGGWGPDSDYRWLVEQVAIVGRGDDANVIGVMAQAARRARSLTDSSAFEAGTRLVQRHAARAIQRPLEPTRGARPCA